MSATPASFPQIQTSLAPALALSMPPIPAPPASAAAADTHARLQSGTACSTSWSAEEQATLQSAMYRFPADKFQPLERYIRMAATLTKKSVRDVAFRVRWMGISQAERKRTADNEGTKQRQQQQFRRERGQSIFNVQPNVPISHLPMYSQNATSATPGFDDHGSATVGAMGGPIAQLLEQNYAVLNQFKRNMAHCKVSENTDLLARFRDNILAILAQMSAMPGVMQQMPPLPVRVNMELAQNFLPKSVGGAFPMGMPFMPPPMSGMLPGAGMNGFLSAMHPAPNMLQPVSAPQDDSAAASAAHTAPASAVQMAVTQMPPMQHLTQQQQQQQQQPQHSQPQTLQMPQQTLQMPQQTLQMLQRPPSQPQQHMAPPGMFMPHNPGMPMTLPNGISSVVPAPSMTLPTGQMPLVPPHLRPPLPQTAAQPLSMPGVTSASMRPMPAYAPAAMPSAPAAVPAPATTAQLASSQPMQQPGFGGLAPSRPGDAGLHFAPHGPFSVASGSQIDYGFGQQHQLQAMHSADPMHVSIADANHSQPVTIKAE